MTASYVNDNQETWVQFLREFAYALRTAVNETTEKTPEELFWGRKLITPFQSIAMVSVGTEFAVGDIEKLLEEHRFPRVTTPNEDRYLEVTAKSNRRSAASDLSRQLSSATGTTVSRQSVYRQLGHTSLYARRPVRCVPLTATHCRLRLTLSREHTLWTPQQWSCVMFSDEFRLSLQSDSRRTLIERAPGTSYHQESTIE
ncbi:HTH_Tnp_Tc3_2 domain-containing protein [Trichonephila clavipes]|nr:HTH_Tnp_Tc3_2 domain-containing protein [Trichonephila clavipes]